MSGKKKGRPLKEETKSVMLYVRVTESEKKQLQSLANEQKTTISAILLSCLKK